MSRSINRLHVPAAVDEHPHRIEIEPLARSAESYRLTEVIDVHRNTVCLNPVWAPRHLILSPIGDWGHLIVVFGVLLFAISTAISWSYYGDRCAHYLLGQGAVKPYKLIFVAMHFVGAVIPLAVVWSLGDIALAIVIVPNLIALIFLTPQVVEMTKSYFERKPWEVVRGEAGGAD